MKTAKKMARGGKVKMARGGKVMMARGGKVGESDRTISDADRARIRRESGRTMSDRDIQRLLGESDRTISDADRARARKGFAKGGKVKGKDDQSMCSPRKQMAMGKK